MLRGRKESADIMREVAVTEKNPVISSIPRLFVLSLVVLVQVLVRMESFVLKVIQPKSAHAGWLEAVLRKTIVKCSILESQDKEQKVAIKEEQKEMKLRSLKVWEMSPNQTFFNIQDMFHKFLIKWFLPK